MVIITPSTCPTLLISKTSGRVTDIEGRRCRGQETKERGLTVCVAQKRFAGALRGSRVKLIKNKPRRERRADQLKKRFDSFEVRFRVWGRAARS